MPSTTVLFIAAGLIVLMVVCVLAGLWVLVGALNPEPTKVQTRLKTIRQGPRPSDDDAFQTWLHDQTTENDATDLTDRLFDPLMAKLELENRLKRTGLTIPAKKFLLLFVITPLVLGALLFSQQVIPLTGLLGFGIIPLGGLVFLGAKAKQRSEKLEQQLPDALNMLSSSLRAGHSFSSATQILAQQLVTPIQPVFEDIHNDLKLGVPVKDSLHKMLQTVDVVDFRIFATAVLVQRESGGNLAEIMDQLGSTIRERAKLKRQIQVLTAQPRLSAYLIGAAPIVMYILLQFIMPGYTQVLEEHPVGPFVIGGMIGMQIAGFFVMRRIVAIRI